MLPFRLSLAVATVLWMGVARSETIRFPLPDGPATLDWTAAATTTEGPVIHLLAEGLYRYESPSGKLIPAIAESVMKSPDLKEYTFRIRSTAKWSDGRQIRAQDFVDGWLRVLSPASSSLYNYYLFDVENALEYFKKILSDGNRVGIKAKDDRTLVVRLNRPVRNWEATTTFWPLFPVRKDLIDQQGTKAWKPGVLASSGPFVLVSVETNGLELKPNPHYQKFKSNVDRVLITFDRDPVSISEKFKSGQYSFVPGLGENLRKRFIGSPFFQEFPILRNHTLVSNAEKFPMSSRDFRKAVFLSLDREKILKRSGIQASISKSMIPFPLLGSEELLVPRSNPEAAKRHLSNAGVVQGKGLKIRLLTRIDPANVSVAEEIRNQLQKSLGVTVEVEALPEKEFGIFANMNEFDLILVGWSAKVRSPEDFLRPYSPMASNSRLRYKSQTYQDYLEEGMGAISSKDSSLAFRQAQIEYLQTEMVLMPLLDEKFAVLQSAGLNGLQFNHMGFPILNHLMFQSKTVGRPKKMKR
jgi:oligopeptide transport system substrate-binding protein